jgi:hypothetical protein
VDIVRRPVENDKITLIGEHNDHIMGGDREGLVKDGH